MSGPKRSEYKILDSAAEQLRARRQQEMEREARRRAEIKARRRREQMETHRKTMLNRLADVTNHLQSARGKMDKPIFEDLEAYSNLLQGKIHAATTEHTLDSIEGQLKRFTHKTRTALRDMSQKIIQMQKEALRLNLESLNARVSKMGERQASRVDASRYRKLKNSLLVIRKQIDSGKLKDAATASSNFENHLVNFEQQYEEWTQRAESVQRELAERKTAIDAAAQDPCVATWNSNKIESIKAELEAAQRNFDNGELESAADGCKGIDQMIDTAVAEANAEQLKADKRDYVVQSIAGVLEDMGFVVSSYAEHEGSPDTSMILSAVNASGQVVALSVPVEGEVFYDVDGYPIRSETTVDGSVASNCDEAQAVIEDMHQYLAAGYDIQMGELLWDGKADPDRLLRKADELPNSSDIRRGGQA